MWGRSEDLQVRIFDAVSRDQPSSFFFAAKVIPILLSWLRVFLTGKHAIDQALPTGENAIWEVLK